MWSTCVLEKGINNNPSQFYGLPPFDFRSRLPHPAGVISKVFPVMCWKQVFIFRPIPCKSSLFDCYYCPHRFREDHRHELIWGSLIRTVVRELSRVRMASARPRACKFVKRLNLGALKILLVEFIGWQIKFSFWSMRSVSMHCGLHTTNQWRDDIENQTFDYRNFPTRDKFNVAHDTQGYAKLSHL